MLCTSGFMDDITFGHSRHSAVWQCMASNVVTPGLSLMSMNALLLRSLGRRKSET